MRSVRNSFHIREPGKMVLSVENHTLKKKKIFFNIFYKWTKLKINECDVILCRLRS